MYCIPSNGFFDTTEAHATIAGFETRNLFSREIFEDSFQFVPGRNHFMVLPTLATLCNLLGEHRLSSTSTTYQSKRS